MSNINIPAEAITRLRDALDRVMNHPSDRIDEVARNILDAKESVLSHYGRIFSPANISALDAGDFRSFLNYKNNCHWEGLHRRGPAIVSDLPRLRSSLAVLLDEGRPIAERVDALLNGRHRIQYLGPAIATAVLLVAFPDRYSVWNHKSADGMRFLGIWPESSGLSKGDFYAKLNSIALAVAAEMRVDLWTLDMLWWRVIAEPNGEAPIKPPPTDGTDFEVSPVRIREGNGVFALEAHLHEFLQENWDRTELGKEWELLEEEGEVIGSHYRTEEVGEIDLLARHKSEKRWLVVELKRNQSSDATIGQVARYMAWVSEKLAKPEEQVEGLIVCLDADTKLQYAMKQFRNVRCMAYEVSFRLQPKAWS